MVLLEKEVNGKVFKLVKNSIIEEKVDAIVNPANNHLAHGGGVAGLIVRAGGQEIQAESLPKAPVPTGQATYTSAGTLPFKYILHTVGPIWRGGNESEPELLDSAVTKVLELAAELELKTLSMPSISTGIFGYPVKPAIKIIIAAILRFLKEESTVQTIHLCEFDAAKAEEIKTIITETI
ncbi:MAG: macro domain-containing protein [bacterium]|nr:macro domain-containing protein [bacterium]